MMHRPLMDIPCNGPGTFVENITLNKELTLTGAGSGSNPATNTVFSASAPCGGIGISISAANVTVQNIYVTGYQEAVRLNGVNNPTINNMNLVDYCQYGVRISSTNSSIDITNTTIQRTSPMAGTVGIRVGTADAVNGMLISNSTITGNNLQGMVVFQSTTPVAFDNIIIQNSVISNNLQKGLYFEKLSNATLSGLVMNNNGTDPGYNNNNGIDINLKHNAYSNITIQDCDITNSAVMGTAVDPEAAAAITIKARDDAPSYNTIPASLNNVMIKNNRITGPQNGIRIGEYGKINATPTNVVLEGNDLSHVFANKTLISRINADINLDCNWHGTTNIPTIEATFTEAGTGMILLNDLLSTGGDGSANPGFQPTGNCACPSGFAIINTTTMVAYCDIQAALDASQPGEEIHITSGTGVGFFEVEYGKVLVVLNGVNFTSNGEICNNGIITVNAGGTFNNAGTYSGKGVFNGAFNNVAGGKVKPGGCGL
ncbi:MAG: right-handed parallel beta-helix repeat-containing protein [Saprospiraceae bacterium]|nr:right-handed parallel beta-helix repeat-containing protein [Saprospiraceae bacterium]